MDRNDEVICHPKLPKGQLIEVRPPWVELPQRDAIAAFDTEEAKPPPSAPCQLLPGQFPDLPPWPTWTDKRVVAIIQCEMLAVMVSAKSNVLLQRPALSTLASGYNNLTASQVQFPGILANSSRCRSLLPERDCPLLQKGLKREPGARFRCSPATGSTCQTNSFRVVLKPLISCLARLEMELSGQETAGFLRKSLAAAFHVSKDSLHFLADGRPLEDSSKLFSRRRSTRFSGSSSDNETVEIGVDIDNSALRIKPEILTRTLSYIKARCQARHQVSIMASKFQSRTSVQVILMIFLIES